jgi:hypothetical protein
MTVGMMPLAEVALVVAAAGLSLELLVQRYFL